MSLINRTAYLATLVDKLNQSVQPIVSQYNSISSIQPDRVSEINQTYDSMITDILNQSGGVPSESAQVKIDALEEKRAQRLSSYNEKVTTSKQNLQDRVAGMAQDAANEVDGVSVDISASETLVVTPTADAFNPVTDFVKNSMTSPETKVVVNTTVVGTAGGDPIVGGIGTQPNATITTT